MASVAYLYEAFDNFLACLWLCWQPVVYFALKISKITYKNFSYRLEFNLKQKVASKMRTRFSAFLEAMRVKSENSEMQNFQMLLSTFS